MRYGITMKCFSKLWLSSLMAIILHLSFPLFGQKNDEIFAQKVIIAKGKYSDAYDFISTNNYDSAIYYFRQASHLFEEQKLYFYSIKSRIRICEIHLSNNQPDSALIYAKNALLITDTFFLL